MSDTNGSAPAGNPAADATGTSAAAALTTPAAPAAAPAIEIPWLQNADADTAAFVKNKGWDKTGPGGVVDSYRNLEKLLGAERAGRTVEIPGEGADEHTLEQFYSKIGRPAAPEGYELPIPEGADPEFAKWAAGVFHKHGLPAKAAAGVTEAWNQYVAEKTQAMAEVQAQNLSKQQQALSTEWGAALEKNTNVAKAAVAQLGLSADQITAIEAAIGFDGVMKMFHKLGTKIGEDSFVGGDRSGGSEAPMTPAQAKQALDGLLRDKDFVAAWSDKSHPGHQAAIEKKARLSRMQTGVA